MKFKDMSTWSKILFVSGWINFAVGLVTAVSGIIDIVYANMLGEEALQEYVITNETGLSAVALVEISGAIMIVFGVISVLAGVFSVLAAKNKGKLMVALALISTNLVVYGFLLYAGNVTISTLLGLITILVGLVACIQINRSPSSSN